MEALFSLSHAFRGRERSTRGLDIDMKADQMRPEGVVVLACDPRPDRFLEAV